MGNAISVVGIDPGRFGALALILGDELRLFDSPMLAEKRGNTKKLVTDINRLCGLARILVDMQPSIVVIERVWGVKGQSASTGAALGHARGCLETAFCAIGCTPTLISPQRWKGDLRLFGKPKEDAIQLAIEIFPKSKGEFLPIRKTKAREGRTTEMCIGRADAALIAHHARLQCTS